MTDITNLIAVCNEQLEKVREIADSRVTFFAQSVAFYAAMLEAAEDDAIEDEEIHRATFNYLQAQYRYAMHSYMTLVNDSL